MKHVTRLLNLVLALMLIISMAGCAANKDDGTKKEETETPAAQTEEKEAPEASTEEEAPAEEETPAEEASTTRTVTDHAGNEVEIPAQIDRIVVADIYPMPSVLTIFFDSAEKIVGMAPASMTAAQNSLLGELYPEILNASTAFTDGSDVNIEELMKLEPDIVFYSASSAEIGEKLKNAGIPGIAISVNKWEYNTIETLNQWILLLSEIFPENDKYEIVSKKSNEIYEMVQERVKDIPEEERRRAFFLFQYSEAAIATSGEKFFGQFWADAIGAINVSKELSNDNSASVSMEQIYSWDPDLIFITNFNTAKPEDLYANTVADYDWSEIDAVKNQQAFKMPLGMYRSYTPGADTPVTLLWLAKTAYPEVFADIDVTQEAINYYQEVFGVTLTAEQVERIFQPSTAAGHVFD